MSINSVVRYKATRVLTTAERFEALKKAVVYEAKKLRAQNKNAA